MQQERQLAELEAEPELGSVCENCARSPPTPAWRVPDQADLRQDNPYTLRRSVNEVAVFFAATDHGKSVSDLTRQDVVIQDAGRPPRGSDPLSQRVSTAVASWPGHRYQRFDHEGICLRAEGRCLVSTKITNRQARHGFRRGLCKRRTAGSGFHRQTAQALRPASINCLPEAGPLYGMRSSLRQTKLASIAEEKPSAKIVVRNQRWGR